MPPLTDLTETTRKAQALQVWMLMQENSDLKVVDACAAIGISKDQYYDWIQYAREGIEAFQILTEAQQRYELSQLLLLQEKMTMQVLKDGINPLTDPATRLQIKRWSEQRIDDLSDRFRTIPDEVSKSLFTGPEQVEAQSRFAAKLTASELPDGSLSITVQQRNIIDSKFREVEEEE